MKREMYITLLLLAIMMFALASTMVRAQHVERIGQSSRSLQLIDNSSCIVPCIFSQPNDNSTGEFNLPFVKELNDTFIKNSIPNIFLNRGLQVVNWSSRSLFALLHSLATQQSIRL